jgi:hypothetical protein
VKNDLEIDLGPTTPHTLLAALDRVPGLRVRHTATHPYVQHGNVRWPVRLLPRPIEQITPEATADQLVHLVRADGNDVVPLVLASSLPRPLRAALEERGVSYADARGDVHLVAPGLFVHVDGHPTRLSVPRDNAPSGIGIVGIRAVQALAENPNRSWSVAELAGAAQVSNGEAYKVLRALQMIELVETEGTGPNKRRRVPNIGALLDWLAAQPRGRRVAAELACSLYARTPLDLAVRASRSLDSDGIPHAFTATLAATILGAGPTAVPRATLRIDPGVPLERAAQILGAEETTRGANLLLWTDTGRVGTLRHQQHQDVWVAPPTRIYLDLLGERRGDDVAAHFREIILKA